MSETNDVAYIYTRLRTLLGGTLPIPNFDAARELIERSGNTTRDLFAKSIGAVAPSAVQTLTKLGRDHLKQAEGMRTKAYLDTAGIPTIAFGNTYHPDGRRVRMGDVITAQQADQYFDLIVPKYEAAVRKIITVPLTPHQFDALVSFVYNIGATEFLNGTVDDAINRGDLVTARKTWALYNKVRNPKTGRLEVEPGLNNRRRAELALFDKR